jgi:hypothetical protein
VETCGAGFSILVQPAASTLIVAGFPSPFSAGQAGTFTVTAEDGSVAAPARTGTSRM